MIIMQALWQRGNYCHNKGSYAYTYKLTVTQEERLTSADGHTINLRQYYMETMNLLHNWQKTSEIS